MSFSLILSSFPLLFQGLLVTLLLSIASMVGSTIIGLIAATLRTSRIPIGSLIARAYVEIFRGSPLLITLLFVYYGVAYAGYDMNVLIAAIIGISIYHGAYIAEIIRGGIEAVPHGQWEASRILGLSNAQTFGFVILPQTRRLVLPPLIGQYIGLIKDTSLAFIIGLAELMRQGQSIIDRAGQPVLIYFLVAIMYFIICYPLSLWVQSMDKRSRLA
jgi:polar amino acid transport system permease protein